MAEAVVLLGSNINPVENSRKALRLLQALFDVRAVSSAWETPAVDSDGPNFINLAVIIQTSASPAQLKAECLRRLEHRLGRIRTGDKNAPRTMDLDVIIYDRQVLDAGLWRQAHIAIPIAELVPDLIHPENKRKLADIAGELASGGAVLRRRELDLPD